MSSAVSPSCPSFCAPFAGVFRSAPGEGGDCAGAGADASASTAATAAAARRKEERDSAIIVRPAGSGVSVHGGASLGREASHLRVYSAAQQTGATVA